MQITDENLLKLCEDFGSRALEWRRKFIGLLPEVNRRRLHEKRGCQSIFEFAAKLAGVSKKQVRVALRLEKRFEDKPILRELLTQGEVSINKLARVASIATSENEEELAEQVKVLPRMALEALVRDELHVGKSLHVQTSIVVQNFQLSDEVTEELNQLHEQGQDVSALLMELLKQRKKRIEEKKEELGEAAQPTDSRYMVVAVRGVLKEEFGKKCSIKNCRKPAEEIHHSQRFSVSHVHDPRYLAPLCKGHHQLAHMADQGYRAVREKGGWKEVKILPHLGA